ncbi:MAG: SDR family NAD(P)-dependent oxidoreductase, partial [Proteobacteria bacterium]|nr:SDR family NAD(P)-dependent oxidoreductase [Pseudomonadota bacterium]
MLKGKTILVTGAFGRLGRPLADCLAGHGATVIMTTRDEAKARQFNTNADPSSPVRARHLPFGEEEEFRQAVEMLIDEVPRIDGLVNNAYPEMKYQAVGAIPWDYWATASHVSLAVTETLSSSLVKRRAKTCIASIVNVSSIYGLRAP